MLTKLDKNYGYNNYRFLITNSTYNSNTVVASAGLTMIDWFTLTINMFTIIMFTDDGTSILGETIIIIKLSNIL